MTHTQVEAISGQSRGLDLHCARQKAGRVCYDLQKKGRSPLIKNGDFLKWGYPNSWMVDTGKSYEKMDDFGVALFQETSK